MTTEASGPATQHGFHGPFASEALEGALPPRQNQPRHAPFGLYPELLNGVSFTVPRAQNRRTWMYRIRPSTVMTRWTPLAHPTFSLAYLSEAPAVNLVGWRPRPDDDGDRDFLDGLFTVGGAGDPSDRRGFAFHTYWCNRPMARRALSNTDGTLLVLPDTGRIRLTTELGVLEAAPGELLLVPRAWCSRWTRWTERRGATWERPTRGSSSCRSGASSAPTAWPTHAHFRAPVARFDEDSEPWEVVTKMGGHLHRATRPGTPFDVVAWHGELAPLHYDLEDFCPLSTVAFDHADPSVFTVLSAPLDHPGENTLDFVIFPERWDATQDTFRPPFFHRNAATELNGILTGPSTEAVFSRGGLFLTPPHTPHGVGESTLRRVWDASADQANRTTHLGAGARWMQFESTLAMRVSPLAAAASYVDASFGDHVRDLPVMFERP